MENVLVTFIMSRGKQKMNIYLFKWMQGHKVKGNNIYITDKNIEVEENVKRDQFYF